MESPTYFVDEMLGKFKSTSNTNILLFKSFGDKVVRHMGE
jgi:hypothetical protein